MKRVLFWMTAIALFVGCAKETDKNKDNTTDGKIYTITASVDNPETRTVAERFQDASTGSYKYSFSWEDDEIIAVVPTNVNTQVFFDLADAELGTFTHEALADEPEYDGFGLAVTPADALTSMEPTPTNYEINFSGSYLQGCSNAIMVAGSPTIGSDGNQKFQFKHIAALVKVTYKNVPAGTYAMMFEADHNIKGTFHFTSPTGIEASNDAFTTVADDTPKIVEVMLPEVLTSTVASMDFYVPIPIGSYQVFQVRLVGEDMTTVIPGSEQSWDAHSPFTLKVADVVACPEITLPAPRGTVLLSEPFTGFAANATPSSPGSDAEIYNSSTVTYACSGSGTKIYNETLAGGSSPELLVSSGGGEFALSGIPTGYNTSLTVTWYSNNTNIGLYFDGNKVNSNQVGETSQYMAVVTVPAGTASIDLSFKNNASKNGRLDNIHITAGVSGIPAGLVYTVTEFETVLGEAFEAPELTNPHNLAITYASSNTEVAEVNAAGEVTIKAVGTATITASSVATDEYEAGEVSYTITVVAATLTLSEGTTPAKASCAENSTVTFTVNSNIDWEAAVNTNGDPNGIVKSIASNEGVVTVTFNKNTAAQEKTAVIAVTPTKEVFASLKQTITVTQEKFENTDVLTATLIGVSNYSAWSGVSVVSSAKYAGYSTQNTAGDIQLRSSNNNSGIVSTTSGGLIKKVKITWGTGNASDGRTLNIYGSHSKFNSAEDLYASGLTPIATLNSKQGTTEYEFTSDFEYVGVRSASNALYLADIAFTWEAIDPNAPQFAAAINGNANIAADVTTGTVNVTGNVAWTASASNGATVSPTSGNGEGTITVTMPENESFTDPASYVVTVSTQAEVSTKTFNLTFTQDPAVDPNQNDGSAEKPYTVAEALAIISSGNIPTTAVHVAGIISKVDSYNPSYHSITYFISDDGTRTNELEIYGGKNLGSKYFDSIDDLVVDDNVVVCGVLKLYNAIQEMDANNYLYSLNGYTKLLYSISVSGQTTSFDKDDPFVFGGTVTATYTDNSTADVTNSQNVSFTGYDMSETGSQNVTVSYTEDGVTKTAEYTISVGGGGPAQWNLVDALSDLTSGTYIIAALSSGKYYTVPNTTINGQTFTCTEATYSDDSGLTPVSGYGEFTFTAVPGVANAYYIYNTNLNKYLVATGSKKFGYVDSSSSDYGYWTFSAVSSGGFSGAFSVKHSNITHYMRAYSNSVRCYDGTSNNGVYLFVKN